MVDVNKGWGNKDYSKENVLNYLNVLYNKDLELNSITEKFYSQYSKNINDDIENNFLSMIFLSFFTIPLGVYFDYHLGLVGITTFFLGVFLSLGIKIATSIKKTYNFNVFDILLRKTQQKKKTKALNLIKHYRQNKDMLNVLKFISGKNTISSFFRNMSFSSLDLEYNYHQTFKSKLLRRCISRLKKDFTCNEQIEILSNFLLSKKENGTTDFFKEHLLKIVQEEKKRNEEQLIYAENATILNEEKSNIIDNLNKNLINTSKKLSYIKSL